jgi:uncharacterized membrane protein
VRVITVVATELVQTQPTTDRPSSTAGGAPRRRIDCIDCVRGVVMVLMVLDHVKGNFSNIHFDATDLAETTPGFFLTRWITHFCAPTFVFLTGTGAYLHGLRCSSRGQLARFLLSRGMWLIFLEFTVVRFSWFVNIDYAFTVAQVIWAIGCSLVVLAALVFLPTWAVTAFGVAMVALHNLLDGVSSADFGRFAWVWKILHTGEFIEFAPGHVVAPLYPLVPWVGVLACGYGFGSIMGLEPARRRKTLLAFGMALCVAFVALRYTNWYGDRASDQPVHAGPWSVRSSPLFTAFSFVNCQKYPPSLCFLLMTLGPAIVLLALVDREPGAIERAFIVFGRVPLFFYLLHFYLIKLLSILFAYLRYARADWLVGENRPEPPPDNGYDLWVVYLLWIGVVAMLFPLCYWFARVKQRSRSVWLSYL